uniref:Pleckstrin homology domain-containing family G member 3-like n=1 Tax=Poecilia reticulata TaxID=8081 RepID=A0A3P9NCW0_POERE
FSFQSADSLLQEKPLEKPEDSEPEPSAGPDPSAVPEVPQMSEDLQPDKDPEPADPPSSTTFDSDSKTLSSAESSDEDEREAADGESSSPSILPSSVLDKASAIAQHFTSIKRGSLAQDDARSLGCPSPRLPSRTGSMLSLRSESADRPLRLNSNSSDPPEAFGGADLSLLSPRDDSLFEPDRSVRRRRDSTLSKQDQLLIGKIKSYYENAENQDASFGLRRRESLTYIPSGLVRSSVSRFNSIPRVETAQSNPPASRQISRSQKTVKPSISAGVSSLTRTKSCDPDLGNSDLSAVTEDSFSPSLPKTRTALSRAGSQTSTSRSFREETATLRAPVPRVAQLRAEAGGDKPAEETEQTDEVDRAESKVLLLARRYSQRIRSSSPVVRQRSPAGPFNRKTLACVVEEKEGSGTPCRKPSLTLPLGPKVQSKSLPLSPVDPVQNPGGGAPGHAPLSPPPPTEGFNWPDVRELRSRYSSGGGRNQNRPMSRSSTIPDRMLDVGLRRHSSGSPGHLHDDGASSGRPRGGRAAARDERSKRLHRANSLDPRLKDDGYVQIRSPTSREKISIMAVIDRCRAYQDSDDYRLRDAAKTAPPSEQDESQKTRPDSGQSGQTSIVKNLREKFQNQT